MSELINRWFSRAGRLQGAVAYGLRYPDATAFSNTWEPRLTEPVLNQAWNRLMTISTTATQGEYPETLRWSFNGGTVIGTARTDGVTFFVVTSNRNEELDQAGLHRLL
ncbi:MAG TPA: hypothetical protein VK850_15830, partial [Candidatus Binatia bacterium]|nr:hypothetical protein [Candidatus Binatia bacterium]